MVEEVLICLQYADMGLTIRHILHYFHLSVTDGFKLWIPSIVHLIFGNDFQFLIQGMSILHLMVHAGAGEIVLHPGLFLEQRAVIQRVCCIIAGTDTDPHGCIDHGHILFELDAVLSEVIVIGVYVMCRAVQVLIGQCGLAV